MVTFAKFYFGLAIATVASLGISVAVKADTVDARCDIYPAGEDRATSSGPCTYSQRQGVISIQLPDGQQYDLQPSSDQPASYVDQSGQAARRDDGLGNLGTIYRLSKETIYVYWDPAPYGDRPTSPTPTSPMPTSPVATAPPSDSTRPPVAPERTYMTPRNDNQIAVQISDGEFFFRGVLTRTSGNTYIAEDPQVRVTYDREVGRVVVINKVTGTEFYNYPYRDPQRNASEGAL